jgi:hypothetical protein
MSVGRFADFCRLCGQGYMSNIRIFGPEVLNYFELLLETKLRN